MRTAIRMALAAALLCALCAPVSAEVDPYYTGPVDTVTGEAVGASPEEAPAVRVRLSETTYYDRSVGKFAYYTGSGISVVYASVADGMIVSEPVSITPDNGVEVSVYRNGTVMEEADLSNINAAGSYVVSAKGVQSTQPLFGFTIVGETTNLAGGYMMPEGFYIIQATRDDEETYYDTGFIGMEEEGSYIIEYVCPDTSLHYTLATTVDRTPPQLTLDGKLDNKGCYRSAVRVGGIKTGDFVFITQDGAEIKFPADGELTDMGIYQLQVFDAAGNAAQEQFTILMYFDLNSLMFFALVCVSLAGVLGYVLYRRKKLKFF